MSERRMRPHLGAAIGDVAGKRHHESRARGERIQQSETEQLVSRVLAEHKVNDIAELEVFYDDQKGPGKWCRVLGVEPTGTLRTDAPLIRVKKGQSALVNIRAINFGSLKFRRAKK